MENLAELMKNPFKREDFDVHKYWERNKKVGVFGVPYLDAELHGIAKTDLVLIGARSGAGKSSLAKIIYNANDKSKTALFSLENYDGDVEMSLLRQEYAKLTGNWIKHLLRMDLPTRARSSFPHSQSLLSGSFQSLLSSSIRGQTE